MEIGKKLKEARARTGLSQEAIAEAVHVSRQTISNWENEKTYPDILSLIQLSDLYQVSLDELLKGDSKMIEHLEESTNIVASNRRLLAAILLFCGLLIALILVAMLLPNISPLYFIGVFILALIGAGFLLSQIIQRL